MTAGAWLALALAVIAAAALIAGAFLSAPKDEDVHR